MNVFKFSAKILRALRPKKKFSDNSFSPSPQDTAPQFALVLFWTMPAEPEVDVPAGNVKKGAKLFKAKCAQCHTAEKGGAAKQGPPLWNLMGREAGH